MLMQKYHSMASMHMVKECRQIPLGRESSQAYQSCSSLVMVDPTSKVCIIFPGRLGGIGLYLTISLLHMYISCIPHPITVCY